jgi:Flp pilus assembly protein TadG
MMFALSLPVLLGMVGVAVDLATIMQTTARLQGISDAAAIAAVRELSLPNASIDQIESVVANSISIHKDNGREPVSNNIKVDYKAQQVRVELVQEWMPFFAHFIDASVTPIKVRSTARLLSTTTKTCVLALASAGSKAIHLDKRAAISAADCGVYANSTDSDAIRLDRDSKLTAGLICSGGGVKSKTDAVVPEPLSDCPQMPDPLALRDPPPGGGCQYFNVVIDTASPPLEPGIYCGGLSIKGDANVTLQEGDYTIRDGPLEITDKAVVKGNNVGIYLTGSKAIIDCKGAATVELSGRENGAMAGLLLFEDRTAPLGRKHRINCANANRLTGTIYLPRGILLIDPNSPVAAESAYTAIIANRLELDEGADLVLNADYNATDVPVPAGLKPAGTVVLTQ